MKIIIGFISYNQNSLKYLPFFLPSLKIATDQLESFDFEIIALDNSINFSENRDYISDFFQKNNLQSKSSLISLNSNLGFAKGFNLIINKALSKGADFFMAINPDVILEKDSILNLLRYFIEKDKFLNKISSLSPKLLRWDFENKEKTRYIDSLGIGMSKNHHFFDINQGKIDKNDISELEIFGVSGAAAIYNLKALKEVAFDNGKYLEFFDELMFMYKEDVDLSYRLRLSGWESFLVPKAIIYHDRSLSSDSFSFLKLFFDKNNNCRSWSYLNQMIILFKFKKVKFSFSVRFFRFFRLIFLLIYGLIFQNKQIKRLISLKSEIVKRRNGLKIIKNSVIKVESLL